MNFYSLINKSNVANFKEALVNGIAPDRGLYFPTQIPKIQEELLLNLSENELAFELIKPFVGNEIPANVLHQIIEDTLCFDFPLIQLNNDNFFLELFHGPTLAFKDVGARFMSRCLAYFSKNATEKVTVLVATSGDTGGAVAQGFYNVEGVEVVILYPKGRVSLIQEKQLTVLGNNIKALEVDGNFDDCQEMVKSAFLDKEIVSKIKLTSANSINVARWLPQMFYFAFAYKALKNQGKPIVFSVPSGNFGNICAGVLLKKMGLGIHHFIASCNANDVIPNYLKTGVYSTQASIATISNAMDVANPSNFVRIEAIYDGNLTTLKQDISSYSFSDEQTKIAMQNLLKKAQYITDPHGAVAFLGLEQYKTLNPDCIGLALGTAHPCKFLGVVEETIKSSVHIPLKIQELLTKEKQAIQISSYEDLKGCLLT